MLHLQMRFRPVVPLKEVLQVVEEVVAVVVARPQLQALVRYHLDLVLASQHTFGSAAEAVAPLIRHRRHPVVEEDPEAHLAAWASVLAERTEQADLQLDIVSVQLALQRPNCASHL